MAARSAHLQRALSAPVVGDLALAAAVTVLSIVGMEFQSATGRAPQDPDLLAVSILVVQGVALALRRRWPMLVYAVVGVLTVVYSVSGYPAVGTGLAVLIAIYTVATLRPLRETLFAAAVYVFGMVSSVVPYADLSEDPFAALVTTVGFNAVLLVLALVVGVTMRTRRAYVGVLEARAALLEGAREEQARLAVALERERIARELHDEVAHALSLVVVQAAAAERVVRDDPERAAQAMETIRRTGRAALDDMRHLLAGLRGRDEAAELAPQPGLADLDALVGRVSEAGLPVELSVQGERRPLPPIIELSAYRIVQEGLTNALKHAGPARARVLVRYGPYDLELRITDTGQGTGRAETEGAGHGLIGMRERVAVLNGTLSAAGRPEGGFTVEARIPLDGRAP